MARPNFFCGVEALQWLLEHEPKSERDDIDLTVDLIEAPYLFIYTSDAEAWTLKVLQRGELYDHKSGSGVEKGSLRVVRETGEGSGTTSDPALRDNMGAFFEACRRLSRYIRDAELEPLYEGIDPEEAGVLLQVDGDRLSARKVAGKERPELMCNTLFGGTVMCRPYMEDFMERSALEMMDEEALTAAAESGDEAAMEQLAQQYLNGGEDIAQDFAKSAHWWEKLAETGNAVAQFNMGLYCAKGCGVPRDFAKAAEWMRRAAENGDGDAPALAESYAKLAAALPRAEQGDAEAMAELAGGFMGLGGSLDPFGPGEDYRESLKWAQKAVDGGCAAAYWTLALAYEHGRGVPEDHAKATELFKKGAELGDPNCQHSYGCRLANGDGVEQDWAKAFELFQKAAEQGNGLAMRDLGRCYQFGNGCMGNMKTALEWYEKADAVLDDPELHQRVIAFRSLAGVDPGWGEDYPGSAEDERYWAAQAAKQRAENRKSFFEKHESLIVRNADITVRDRLFVESGLSARDDWEEIERRLTEAGGVLRSAVSGKTDYLVCDPDFSGDSKPRGAREQQMKGKKVQVVLVADLLRALGMEPDPEPEETPDTDSDAESGTEGETAAAIAEDAAENAFLGSAETAPEQPDGDAPFPLAEPGADQHPHLDFLSRTGGIIGMFGGMVNQTGTEYAFESLREFNGYEEPIRSIVDRASALDKGGFAAAERAKEMAELFRVEIEYFDPGEDREQQILNGMLRRCAMYNDLRSFAWTLAAHCRAKGIRPADADLQTLRAIARFVQAQDHLNYRADSFCPALCSGPDIHVFFLPDAISKADRETILNTMNQDAEGVGLTAVASLEQLRAELTALLPAMEKIHAALAAARDRTRELSGALADVLFAWCSMTYAARDPIFTEDGPVNNFFEHPDQKRIWEAQWQRQREEYERKAAEEWLKAHEKELNRGARITFSGKKFVFDGSPDGERWLEILEKLTAKGALHRSAVSGQTDYLVCDPRRAGDSKLRSLKEQRAKGRCKDTKVILAEDFYRALGIDMNPPEPEPKPEPKRPAAPAPVDAAVLDDALRLTYENGVRRGDGHYTIGIPDGFVLKEDTGDRAFIAFSPDGTDETDARIVLYDGTRSEISEEQRGMVTPEGMCAALEKASYNEQIVRMFDEVGCVPTPEGGPMGVLAYALDHTSHGYHNNVTLLIGSATKILRVLINDAYPEDLPACEALVRGWLATFQTDETVWETPSVDAPEYAGPLTQALADRWAEEQTRSVARIVSDYNLFRDARVEKFKALQPRGRDSFDALKQDLQALLDRTAVKLGEHFDLALKVIERLQGDERNAPFLPKLLESVGGPLSSTARISITVDDETTLEAFIPKKAQFDKRLQALKTGTTAAKQNAEEQKKQQEAAREKQAEAERRKQEEAARRAQVEAERKQLEEQAFAKKREAERRKEEAAQQKAAANVAKQTLKRQRANAKDAAGLISCSGGHLAAVREDGTVVCAGENRHGRCEVSGWRDVIAVDCDRNNTVGLTRDGRVLIAGWDNRQQSACTAWTGIQQVCVGESCVYGLRADGTVAVAPPGAESAQDVTGWRNISRIGRGADTCFGLDQNGTLRSVRRTADGYVGPGVGDGRTEVLDAAVGGIFTRCHTLHPDGSCGAFTPGQLQSREIVRLCALDDLPAAILSDGSILLPESDRLRHVADFLRQHSGERFVALSGDDAACALLTEDGRVYVAAREDAALKTGEPFGADFRLFKNYGQLMDDRRSAKRQRESEYRRQEQETKAAEKTAAQTRQPQPKQSNPANTGMLMLIIGALVMIISTIGACQPYRDTSIWLYPMIVGVIVFCLGYVIVKDQKKKK